MAFRWRQVLAYTRQQFPPTAFLRKSRVLLDPDAPPDLEAAHCTKDFVQDTVTEREPDAAFAGKRGTDTAFSAGGPAWGNAGMAGGGVG